MFSRARARRVRSAGLSVIPPVEGVEGLLVEVFGGILRVVVGVDWLVWCGEMR